MNTHFSPSLLEPNTRAVIGGNSPPSPIDLAKEGMTALSGWLSDHPVIQTDDDARGAKLLIDRCIGNCVEIERERDSLVRPLNEQVSAINAKYKAVHNTDPKKPGIVDKVLIEAKARGTAYLKRLEQERIAAAEAAEAARAEAERIAREADRLAQEAALDAKQGVCDIDLGAVITQADEAFEAFQKADRIAARAERDTKVRLTGGFGNAMGLRTAEILTVTDWKAAIEDIGLTDTIRDAILTGARAYRKENHELPSGIASDFKRGL